MRGDANEDGVEFEDARSCWRSDDKIVCAFASLKARFREGSIYFVVVDFF